MPKAPAASYAIAFGFGLILVPLKLIYSFFRLFNLIESPVFALTGRYSASDGRPPNNCMQLTAHRVAADAGTVRLPSSNRKAHPLHRHSRLLLIPPLPVHLAHQRLPVPIARQAILKDSSDIDGEALGRHEGRPRTASLSRRSCLGSGR